MFKILWDEYYFVLAFFLNMVTFFYFLKKFGIRSHFAFVLGLLFTFLPYHLNHALDKGLASTFCIPLQIMAFLSLYSEKRRNSCYLLVACLMGCLDISYFLFFQLLCLVAGVGAAFYHRKWEPIWEVGIWMFSSSLIYWIFTHIGLIQDFSALNVSDTSEKNGLSLDALLMPHSQHPIHAFNKLRSRYRPLNVSQEVLENTLGIVGTVGFGLLLFQSFIPRCKWQRQKTQSILKNAAKEHYQVSTLRVMSVWTLFLLYLSRPGGGGTFISLFLTSKFPHWNRMSIYIAFFSFIALGLKWEIFQQKLEEKNSRFAHALNWGLPLFVLIFGLLDQGLFTFMKLPKF